ncbi:MAG: transposase [Candidatus Omnitrophica bacterium]|nr:transposase [Candidatus Omnitrophota bacterium]
MPRTHRDVSDPGLYHIINRGNNRMQIFRDNDDYQHYLRLLKRYKSLFNFKLYAFCLMPNHVHLLLDTIGPHKGASQIMHRLNLAYSSWFQLRYEWKGHVWQGPFHSLLIDKERYLYACARYIELNPYRAGLARDPVDYPWSSFRDHLLPKSSGLLDQQEMADYLSLGPDEKFIQVYSDLVQSSLREQV